LHARIDGLRGELVRRLREASDDDVISGADINPEEQRDHATLIDQAFTGPPPRSTPAPSPTATRSLTRSSITPGPSFLSGNKLNPAPLGFATVVLSAVALAGAVQWERHGGREGDRRLATVLAFLIPAGVCFTTIGRLWYLPGVLLLVAAILVLAASTRNELAHAVSPEHWVNGLVALLAGYYLFLGGDALPHAAGVLGILGALAIWAALIATRSSHRVGRLLLLAGALPFAAATWWSIVTPIMAVLIITLGARAIQPSRRRTLTTPATAAP